MFIESVIICVAGMVAWVLQQKGFLLLISVVSSISAIWYLIDTI